MNKEVFNQKQSVSFVWVLYARDAGTEKGLGGPSLKRALSKQQKGSFSVSSEAPTASGRRHLSRQSHNYITIFLPLTIWILVLKERTLLFSALSYAKGRFKVKVSIINVPLSSVLKIVLLFDD